jgi:hypothetical protein
MNERLKELAEQAGLEELGDGDWCSLNHPDVRAEHLEHFADLVRQDEREACAADYLQDCCDAVEAARLDERELCAKIALKYEPTERQPYVTYAADEIRARGEK